MERGTPLSTGLLPTPPMASNKHVEKAAELLKESDAIFFLCTVYFHISISTHFEWKIVVAHGGHHNTKCSPRGKWFVLFSGLLQGRIIYPLQQASLSLSLSLSLSSSSLRP